METHLVIVHPMETTIRNFCNKQLAMWDLDLNLQTTRTKWE